MNKYKLHTAQEQSSRRVEICLIVGKRVKIILENKRQSNGKKTAREIGKCVFSLYWLEPAFAPFCLLCIIVFYHYESL